MLTVNPAIKSEIEKLWSRFWSGGISNPLSAIEQITYLLFMKRIDDLDIAEKERAAKLGRNFKSRFAGVFYAPDDPARKYPVDNETLRWSVFSQLPPEEMLNHVQKKVFPFIKTMSGAGTKFSQHMSNAVFIIPTGTLLAGAVASINRIYSAIDLEAKTSGHLFQDIQGDVYELLLNEISSAGRNGQFRTPRHIIKLVTEILDPKIGDTICDPACGTGGFLLDAYQYMHTGAARSSKSTNSLIKDEDGFVRTTAGGRIGRSQELILTKSLNGFDFDGTMVRLALMNLMMHGIDNPSIDQVDTLSKTFKSKSKYDVVLANPPFTGSIDRNEVDPRLVLKTSKTELLFLERIYEILKSTGKAGVIIPQGVLFGAAGAHLQIRKRLIDEANLQAVISLPSGVFKPYASVATAILVFSRQGQTSQCWFYDVKNDGMTLDDRRQRIPGSDLPDVIDRWRLRDPRTNIDRSENSFFVPVEEIRKQKYNLLYNRYYKHKASEFIHENPKQVLEMISSLEDRIADSIRDLRELI